jgi:hypothetical protein
MSFDVGKSRISEFLTMRDLTKSGTKEELAALCFSACKLNLPLVPSQDDVLKDHCGGHHPVSVVVNTLFLKYTSCCCCSTYKCSL